jgi:hypothetical protein
MLRPVVKRAFQLANGDRVRITGTGDFTIRDVRERSDLGVPRVCFTITLNDRRRIVGLPAHEHVLTIEENDD